MSIETVARRYAGALADVVLKTGETQTVQAELKVWEEMLRDNGDLAQAFSNPAIAHLRKERLLESLIAKSQPTHATANFLRILLQNGRISDLSEINSRLTSVLEERAGFISGKVVSARELRDDEKAELHANIERMTGKRVSLNFAVDQAIIGGVVTTVGSTVYDGSVKTQLQQLKQELING